MDQEMAYMDLLEEPAPQEQPKIIQMEITPTFFEHNRFASNNSKPMD